MRAALLLTAVLAAGPLRAQEEDKTQLLKIKTAFEQAAAQNKPELLEPYLGEGFKGEMFFKQIQGKDGLKDLFARTTDDLGRKNKVKNYRIEIIPDDKSVSIGGGRAKASGTTKETVETPLGKITYVSRWQADFEKKDGRWAMSRMDSRLDPADSIATAVAGLVRETWNPLKKLYLRPPKMDEPNYDGNTGLIYKEQADSLPGPGR